MRHLVYVRGILFCSILKNLTGRELTERRRTEIRTGTDGIEIRSGETRRTELEKPIKTGTVRERKKGTKKRGTETGIGIRTGTETKIRTLTELRTSPRNPRIRC